MTYDIKQVTRYVLINKSAGDARDVATFTRRDEAEKALAALTNPILDALVKAFGPAVYGPPCAFANEAERTNPYVSFCDGFRGKDTPEVRALLIERLIANVAAHRGPGSMILRSDPYFSGYDDVVTLNARLTFTGGIDRTGDREGKGPVFA